MKLQLPKGTKDYLPEEQIERNKIVESLRKRFELYGYSPLKTPLIERFEVLSSKYTGGAEILKETFNFKDQGKRELGLRYDLTVPLARVVGMNPQLKMPFKRYAIGAVFRDGPVASARYRQFMQCDVDIIGCKTVYAEAELIEMASDFFKEFGFNVLIRMNNRMILNKIMEYADVKKGSVDSAILAIDKLEKFGLDEVKKELKQKGLSEVSVGKIVQLINLNGSNEKKLIELRKILGEEAGIEEMEELLYILSKQGVDVEFDVSLARGLSYYTGTIIEVFLKGSKITSAVCAGGRYDNMIKDLLEQDKEFPAVGISFGLDRIYDALTKKEDAVKSTAKVFIAPIRKTLECLDIAKQLRSEGINVAMDLQDRGISKNLDYCNKLGIPYVIIVGETELEKEKYQLKNMKSGEEKAYSINKIIKVLKEE